MRKGEILRAGGVFAFLILFCLIVSGQQPISAIKILPLGSVVTTTGTISTGEEWGQIRYMQDAEAGIAMYSNMLSSTVPGDSVIVTGVLSQYRGELQLSPVMSFQKVDSGKILSAKTHGRIDLVDFETESALLVRLSCLTIQTCDAVFHEGVYNLVDQWGEGIAGVIHSDYLLVGTPIQNIPYIVTGILTRLDGQQRMLISGFENASEYNCHLIPPGKVIFEIPDSTSIAFENLPHHLSFIEWGEIDFDYLFAYGISGSNLIFTPFDVEHGTLYQVRLKQINPEPTAFNSKPIWFTPPSSGEPIEIYFNRGVNTTFSDGSAPVATGSSVIESDVSNRIDQVSNTLDIAMYNTGKAPIVQAINRAVQRGVEVRYIADDETSNSALDDANFPVMYRSGDGIMHHKFMVADVDDPAKAWLWTGSTNFTSGQLATDPNHACVIHDQAFARNYKREFDELWGTLPNHSDGRVGETKDDNTCHLFRYNGTVIESYFSPSDETECHILNAVSSADHQLLVGLLLLTSESLTDEIIAAHQRGVEVRVILEDEESSSFSVSRLRDAGVPYEFHDPSNIFHHKYAIIDEGYPDSDPLVISGSHNWTWSADNINDENTLIFHDQSITNIFRQEYEARWSELHTTSLLPDAILRWQYYPNPAKDILHLTNAANESCIIQFIDADGRLRLTTAIGSNSTASLNVSSSLIPGCYFIKWIWKDQLSFSKLTVVR